MNQEEVNKILDSLEFGYDLVAEKFSGTRSFFWPDLDFIKNYIKKGDRVLDFGCGNGRLLDFLADTTVEYRGVDVSEKLIDFARKKHLSHKDSFMKISSQGSLPFSDEFFNACISIAVFHHFPPEHAEKIAKELYRITKKDGRVIVTVWNLWQRKKWKYIIQSFWPFGKFKDIRIPFKDNQGNVFFRYHRAYTKSDLRKIFKTSGFQIEKLETVNKKNIILLGRKG